MSDIHAVYFYPSDGWNTTKARAWLKKEGIKPRKRMRYEGEQQQMRYSIIPKEKFERFITKVVNRGVHIVIGFYKKGQRGRGGMDLTGFRSFIDPQLRTTGWLSGTAQNMSELPFQPVGSQILGHLTADTLKKLGY